MSAASTTPAAETSAPSDHIEKRILLHAPVARVWRALTEAEQFGHWFGMTLEGSFALGAAVRGRTAMTQVDREVAALQEPHAGQACVLFIEAIEPMHRFAFRWHPCAPEPGASEDSVPTTTVTFSLNPTPAGVWLTVTEAGFDALPAHRRAQAFADNDGGWALQTRLIARYLADEHT